MKFGARFAEREGYPYTDRQLVAMVLPIILEIGLVSMVGMIDSVMVSILGESAIAGVSLVDTTYALVTLAFQGMANGAAVLFGHLLGGEKKADAVRMVSQAFTLFLVTSIAVSALVLAFRVPVLHLLFGSIAQDVEHNAHIYMTIVAFSIPFICLYYISSATFRIMGDTAVPMKMTILMNAVHIPLNALFLYVLHTGVEGAAISTLISRATAAVAIMLLLRNRSRELYLARFPAKPVLSDIRRILHLGLPRAAEQGIFQLGTVLLLSITSVYGTMAIAANSVSYTAMVLQAIGPEAFIYVLQTASSHCIGARRPDLVRYYTRRLLVMSYAVSIVLNLLTFALCPLLFRAYHLSAETAALSWTLIVILGIAFMTVWPVAFDLPGVLWAADDSAFGLYHSLFCVYAVRIVFSYIFAVRMNMGVVGTRYAMCLDWIVRAVLVIWRYRKGKWVESAEKVVR